MQHLVETLKNYQTQKGKKLTTTINNLLFNLRNGEEITSKVYIDFENKIYREIEYGEYTVPAFTLKIKRKGKSENFA